MLHTLKSCWPSLSETLPEKIISEATAKTIAVAAVPGRVTNIAIEKKSGKLSYVVEIDADNGPETDVIIDLYTGAVLAIE